MSSIEIGRLLRSSISGCAVGCRVSQLTAPSFGGLVRIPLEAGYAVYGLIYDIHIDDDGLVRQLVTAEAVADEIILDNRMNRNVPVEISVLFAGSEQGARVSHLLPPRPPLTLDAIYTCTDAEIQRFTTAGRFGYLRHILRAADLAVGELLAAHLRQADLAHKQTGGDPAWLDAAVRELITLLRDDYPTLMNVLSSVAEVQNSSEASNGL